MNRYHMSKEMLEARRDRVRALQAEYRKNAKIANSRLYMIEHNADSSGLWRFSYSSAIHDTQAFFHKNRFSYAISAKNPDKVSLRELTHYNTVVKNFLDSPTSTISGFKKVYEKARGTIKDLYGIDISADEAAEFYASSYWKKLSNKYGSKTAAKIVGNIQKADPEVIDDIHESIRKHKSYRDSFLREALDDTFVMPENVDRSTLITLRKIADFKGLL